MSAFIDAAYKELLRQKDVEAPNQVGSAHPPGPDTVGKEKTDCITYVLKVLTKAFSDVGAPGAAATVRTLYNDGTDLAKYLVDSQDWAAYYWNPDVRFPADNDPEHPSSYRECVRTGLYYKVPVSGYVINYRLTNGSKTTLDRRGLAWLRGVKFGYGIARGAYHCFLVSHGDVYEVHFTEIGRSLYGVAPFDQFPWLSGAILVPPGTALLPSVEIAAADAAPAAGG
jgi:hypothetical protein